MKLCNTPQVKGSSPRVRGKRFSCRAVGAFRRLIPACAGKTGVGEGEGEHVAAHPRVCGENPNSCTTWFRYRGSSPRVRGKRPGSARRSTNPRLIPACAGKTVARLDQPHQGGAHPRVCGENVARLDQPHQGRAHPRVCGENHLPASVRVPHLGSSPRVRGKQRQRSRDAQSRGLIPACAGKTRFVENAHSPLPAHPRVCGENSHPGDDQRQCAGSSPRVRGKRREGPVRPRLARLIPACAGKTLAGHTVRDPGGGSSPRVRGKRWRRPPRCPAARLIPACAGKTRRARRTGAGRRAHPRVCGENARRNLDAQRPAGSSPRVRGKHEIRTATLLTKRLIPACAGKTERSKTRLTQDGAHPRVCGENTMSVFDEARELGSSPRVRGKRVSKGVHGHLDGLIPACAGKTVRHALKLMQHPAHPRVCGENVKSAYEWVKNLGSSPRVRGKLTRVLRHCGAGRLIPACAGKTRPSRRATRPTGAHPRVCGENFPFPLRRHHVMCQDIGDSFVSGHR